MRADEIVKEEKNRDEIVGRVKRRKPLFGFVLCRELLVEAFDKVVGNIVEEALNADMLDCQHRFHWNSVSAVAVGDDGFGFAKMLDGIQ